MQRLLRSPRSSNWLSNGICFRRCWRSVLDASAVLAVVNAEPGADMMRASLTDAIMSAVNYSEVLKQTVERGVTGEAAASFLRGLSIAIILFDEILAAASTDLYPQTKEHGLSLADRPCLALGIHWNRKVLASERRMALLMLSIKVQLTRHHDGKL